MTPRSHAVMSVALAGLLFGPPRQEAVEVTGRVTVLERGNRSAKDVGEAVVWLESRPDTALGIDTVEVLTERKQFRPQVTVITAGSTISFPNKDPFNHNVFSLSEEASSDLGLYPRGKSRSFTFSRPGIVRVYCNVHAKMSAYVLVRDNPHFTRPDADGTFRMSNVPPGRYVLHAWHERARAVSRDIRVRGRGQAPVTLELDARGYKFVQHPNKFGQPYSRKGARY